MFNKHRIAMLELRVGSLASHYDAMDENIMELRRDMDAIARHLGVKFEDIHKRVLVKSGPTPAHQDSADTAAALWE